MLTDLVVSASVKLTLLEPGRSSHRVCHRRHRGNRHHLDLLERRECLRIRDFEDGHLQPKLRQRWFYQRADAHRAWYAAVTQDYGLLFTSATVTALRPSTFTNPG